MAHQYAKEIEGFRPPKGEMPFSLERVVTYHAPPIPEETVPVMVRRFKARGRSLVAVFPNLPPTMDPKSYLINELKYDEEDVEELLSIHETSESMLTAVPNSGTLSFGSLDQQGLHSLTVYEDPESRDAKILLNALKAMGFKLAIVNRIHPGNKKERLAKRDELAKIARES